MMLTRKRPRLFSTVVAALVLVWQFAVPLSASANFNGGGGYDVALTSPTPPAASKTYTWKVSGSKPSPGKEISHLTFKGCWSKYDVVSFSASKGTEEIKLDGTLKVDNLSDYKLPLTITLVLKNSYASTGTTSFFVKTGGGPASGFDFTTAGPNCQAPTPKYGSVEVDKKVDTDGDGFYESGNTTANTIGFKWGLDGDTPANNMGVTQDNVLVGNHTVTENTVDGYVFTGWYYSDDWFKSCNNPRGTTLPVNIDVEKHKTTKITLCNQAKKGSITIVKDAQPDDRQDFDFNIDKKHSFWDDTFILDDDGDNSNRYANSKTYDDLRAGTYVVTEDQVSGWKLTDLTCQGAAVDIYKQWNMAVIYLDKGDNALCTFTNTKEAKLKIVKNAEPNSAQDFDFISPELGSFTLDDDSDPTLPRYEWFDGLSAGGYTITEQAVAGWALDDVTCYGATAFTTKGNSLKVTLAAGDKAVCVFTNVERNTISGYKFEDVNADGVWDKSEPTIQGWTIALLDDNTDVLETVQTDANGAYHFGELLPGIYYVCEDWPQGWIQVTPQTPYGCYEINLTGPGQHEKDVNFGNFKLGTVSGVKFNDRNGNGVRDNGEPTLPGWTITLYQPNHRGGPDTVIDSTQTDATGAYSFGDLLPGDYKVCETQRSSWKRTFPAGSDCHSFTITTSGQMVTADFGNKFIPQVLGESTNKPGRGGELVNTGASATKNVLVGLTILSLLGAAHLLNSRRKDYAQE